MDSSVSIADLPEDIAFHMLLFVPNEELGTIVQVNAQWNKIISGQRYWQAKSEVQWSDISMPELVSDFSAYFKAKIIVEGQPNFLWDKYFCLRTLYEDMIKFTEQEPIIKHFDSLIMTEFSKIVVQKTQGYPRIGYAQRKFLRELLEYFFLYDTSNARPIMRSINAELPENPRDMYKFARKSIKTCSILFPKMEVSDNLSLAKVHALRISWIALHPSLGKATQDNIAFFKEFVKLTMNFVANDFQPRALPSFATFKLHDNEDDVDLEGVSEAYKIFRDHVKIRKIAEPFWSVLCEEIRSEYTQANEDWKRKLSAIYARHLLPKVPAQFAADILPLMFDAMNSTEPELAFSGCTNFIDIIYENSLPEVLDLDQIIKCLKKLIELTEQLPLSYAIWAITSFVKILNPEKSVGISDELLKNINDRILNLISQHHPQTCKAIHCLGDLARSFGSRFIPYLPRYKEVLFTLSPGPLPEAHPDSYLREHERVVDQYVDLAYKSGNVSEAAEMISNIMSLTTADYDFKFLHAYSGLRNAILVQDKPEWVDRIIDSVLSIFRFRLHEQMPVDLVPHDQWKWLPRTEKEWINVRNEISDAISRNEVYRKQRANGSASIFIPPDEYQDDELDNVRQIGHKAVVSISKLAVHFDQHFKKHYGEALATLTGLIVRDFKTFEDEDAILDLLEHLIVQGELSNKEIIINERHNIMEFFHRISIDNADRVAPLFNKVYQMIINVDLECLEIAPMIHYVSKTNDLAKYAELMHKHPLETRLAIRMTRGGIFAKHYDLDAPEYVLPVVNLTMDMAVHFGLRVVLVEILNSYPRAHSIYYHEFKTWAKREDHLDLPYAKKFAILVAALEVDERMIDFCEYSMASEFDWSIFVEALSSDKFDTLNEELNALVKNSDKSVKFWMSLE